MRENLALYMIAAYAIAFFIGGYIWKSIRNLHKSRDQQHSQDGGVVTHDQANEHEDRRTHAASMAR